MVILTYEDTIKLKTQYQRKINKIFIWIWADESLYISSNFSETIIQNHKLWKYKVF